MKYSLACIQIVFAIVFSEVVGLQVSVKANKTVYKTFNTSKLIEMVTESVPRHILKPPSVLHCISVS